MDCSRWVEGSQVARRHNNAGVADTRSGRSACGGLPWRPRKRGARGRGKAICPLGGNANTMDTR